MLICIVTKRVPIRILLARVQVHQYHLFRSMHFRYESNAPFYTVVMVILIMQYHQVYAIIAMLQTSGFSLEQQIHNSTRVNMAFLVQPAEAQDMLSSLKEAHRLESSPQSTQHSLCSPHKYRNWLQPVSSVIVY